MSASKKYVIISMNGVMKACRRNMAMKMACGQLSVSKIESNKWQYQWRSAKIMSSIMKRKWRGNESVMAAKTQRNDGNEMKINGGWLAAMCI